MPTNMWFLAWAAWIVVGCATAVTAGDKPPAERAAPSDFTLQVDALTISPQLACELFPEQLHDRCIALSEIEAFFLVQIFAAELRGMARPKSTLMAGKEYRYARFAEFRSVGEPSDDVWVSRSFEPFDVTLSNGGKDDHIVVRACFEIGGKKQPPVQRECRDGEAILMFADARAKADENRDCILLIPRQLRSGTP